MRKTLDGIDIIVNCNMDYNEKACKENGKEEIEIIVIMKEVSSHLNNHLKQ